MAGFFVWVKFPGLHSIILPSSFLKILGQFWVNLFQAGTALAESVNQVIIKP